MDWQDLIGPANATKTANWPVGGNTTQAAQREILGGNPDPRLGWSYVGENYGYSTPQRNEILTKMQNLNPDLAGVWGLQGAAPQGLGPHAGIEAQIAQLRAAIEAQPDDFILQWLASNEIENLRSRLQYGSGSEQGIQIGEAESAYHGGLSQAYSDAANAIMNRVKGESDPTHYLDSLNNYTNAQKAFKNATGSDLPDYTNVLEAQNSVSELWNASSQESKKQQLAEQKGAAWAARVNQPYSVNIKGLQMPEWFSPFLEGRAKTTPAGIPTGQKEYTLRPLSAQNELPTSKLKQLQYYLGWSKAGEPTDVYDYLKGQQNLPNWWETYTKQSEKLFPNQVRMPTPAW